MTTVAELTTKQAPSWCIGCGDFSILSVNKNSIAQLNLEPHNVMIVTGIGCGSKTNHFIRTYGFEGLHGRALPVATGFKLANEGRDTRSIQHYLGHKNIQHTVRYTDIAVDRFKDFWSD